MVFGCIIVLLGQAVMSSCNASMMRLSDDKFRYAAELAFMNIFLAACPAGIVGFVLKRHITI
jgi:hypothetical protein